MTSLPRQLLLLALFAALLLQGGCAREPGIHLDLQVTRIQLVQGGPLLLNLDYHWRRDAGFILDFKKPMVYVHFLDDNKKIFLQDDHVPPPEVLHGDSSGRTVHYQRCGVLLITDPALFRNLAHSRISIRSGFYEKTEMERKYEVLNSRMRPTASPSALPAITALEGRAAQSGTGAVLTSLPLLLYASRIWGPGSPDPVATWLVPQEQAALVKERTVDSPGALGIEMPARTSAEFVLRPAAGSRLVFTPLARSRALFRVTLRRSDGDETLLLEREITGKGAEISLPLPVAGDEPVGIRLECKGPDPGIWGDARITEPERRLPADQDLQNTLVEIRAEARDWNVILVILDATRADALSCYGNPQRTTPTLDRIARRSVQFIESSSSASYTLSSTASLFSGLYPSTHQVLDWKDRLGEGFPVLGEALWEKGMLTTAIVANPCISGAYGMDRGFDHFVVVPQVRDGRMDSAAVNSCLAELTPQLADPGVSSFFLYLHYLEPHMPYDPPEPIRGLVTRRSSTPDLVPTVANIRDPEHAWGLEREQLSAHYRALYHGNLTHVDFQLAKALARLGQEGLLDRTLLIITSDHGEAFLEHGRMLHGSTVYREEVYVPLLIRFPPSRRKLSGISRHPVNTVDTTAFLLQLLGPAQSPLARTIEGTSYLPSLLGHLNPTEEMTFLMAALDQPFTYGLFNDTQSLVVGPRGVELFHRATDPYELSPDLKLASLDRDYFFQWFYTHLISNSWQDPGSADPEVAGADQALKEQLVALGYAQE
jgi:arylsulfatase